MLIGMLAVVCRARSRRQEKKTREQKVREDREKIEAEGFWIYNDLPRGFAEAKKTGKPLLVVLRCIPCEECVKLDDDLVEQDPVVRPLLDKFVCVRRFRRMDWISGSSSSIPIKSFAAFLLNADGTIYGRFGTRFAPDRVGRDVSLPGLAKSASGRARAARPRYPNNKESIGRQRGPTPQIARPELLIRLQEKYSSTPQLLRATWCTELHPLPPNRRMPSATMVRSSGQPIPDSVLSSYPHPKAIGSSSIAQERAKCVR